MKRGDVVTVSASGDYGRPRPAVIVQTDALPAEHTSVIACQMTSDIADAPDFRITDCPQDRIASEKDVDRLNVALAFVMGLAD